MESVTKRLHILDVMIVGGSQLKFGWTKNMQVVFTTKGIYISALPSDKTPDFSEFIDGREYKVEVSSGSGHMWIAKPRLSYFKQGNNEKESIQPIIR